MKECSRCGQELPDWAVACDCGQRPARSEEPTSDAPLAAPPSSPLPSAPSTRGLGRREILTIAVAILGGGTATLAMLLASGGAAVDPPATRTSSAPAVSRDASPTDPAARLPVTPKWENTTTDWVANAKKGIAFEVKAENRVQIWQRAAHPALVVRCYARQLDVFVYTESAAKIEREDDNHTVRITFDDQAERTERWPDSDEHDALFAPDGRAFVQKLTSARVLRFGYTPHNASPVIATFHVAGLAETLLPAGKLCGM